MRGSWIPRVLCWIFILATLLHYSSNVVAEETASTAVHLRSSSSEENSAKDELRRYIRDAGGRATVIIVLDFNIKNERLIPQAEMMQQREQLHEMQLRVLQRVTGQLSVDEDGELYHAIPGMDLKVNSAQLERLFLDPEVLTVSESTRLSLDRLAFRPASTASPAFSIDYDEALIEAPQLWAKGLGGLGNAVVILDSGIDLDHPAFAGKVIKQACFSSNGNGEVSQCPGMTEKSFRRGSGRNCPISIPGCEHGSNVASVAAGASSEFDGVAIAADLISIKVVSLVTSTNTLTIETRDEIRALNYVFELSSTIPISSINMSFGSKNELYYSPCDAHHDIDKALVAIISQLRAAGIAPVAASGNSGSSRQISSPACISTAIAVGSSANENIDSISTFSNQSSAVSMVAPGELVLGAVPQGFQCQSGDENCICVTDGTYCTETGTSQATPHVAGAIALLEGAYPQAPLTNVVSALSCSGQPVMRAGLTNKRIDLLRAYNYLAYPPSQPNSWNFTTPSEASYWTQTAGAWYTSSGYYSTNIGLWSGSWVPSCTSNIVVTASIRRSSFDSTLHIEENRSGILLDAAVDQDNGNVSGYFFSFNQLMNGSASLFRIDKLNLITNTGSETQLCISSPLSAVNAYGFNSLVASTTGDGRLKFFINGTEVCSVRDVNYRSGQVMLLGNAKNDGAYEVMDVQSVTIQPLGQPANDQNTNDPQVAGGLGVVR